MNANAQVAPAQQPVSTGLLSLVSLTGYQVLQALQKAGFKEAAHNLMSAMYSVRAVNLTLSQAWRVYATDQDRFTSIDGRWFTAPKDLPKPKWNGK